MDINNKGFREKLGKIVKGLTGYSSYIFPILLMLIVSVITYYRVLLQIGLGPIWDTCDFLSNALVFAGQGTGYADLVRPPLLAFLTSIFFRLGYVSSTTIFALDGALFVFGVMGFYLLLKQHFNNVESFLASLIFVSFPTVLSFAGSGLSDIPSISLLIWTIYFTVLAVKRNSKFFYLAFPFLMLAFLTRYAAALVIFPIALYILVNREIPEKLKDIVIGIFLSFLSLLPVLIFFYLSFGSPLYSFSNFYGSSSISASVSPENFAYQPNIFYFVLGLPLYIGKVGFAAVLFMLLGIFIYTFRRIKNRSQVEKPFNNLKLENALTKVKLLIFIILAFLFLGTLGKISYMASEVMFFTLGLVSYWLLDKFNIKDLDFHFLFLSWFMAFFIFHSVYVIKDDRYFLTMAPAVAYFLVLGLSEISNKLNYKIKGKNVTFYLFAVFLIAMMLMLVGYDLSEVAEVNSDTKIIGDNMEAASYWLTSYDPAYKNKVIYSDYWPYNGWYLRTHVGMVPIFKDNQTFYCGVKDYSFNANDNKAFNNYLDSNNVDYYFCVREGLNLTHYKLIKQFGDVVVYEKSTGN